MFCPRCGREQASAVNFCCDCGAPIAQDPPKKRKLTLSSENKKIAGVCGGFAEYFGVDVTLMRLAWVMLALLGGWGLIGYLVAWLIMPYQEAEEKAASAESKPAAASPA